MVYSPANALSLSSSEEKQPLTDEQLEEKAPDLHTLSVYYTNPLYEKITKDQFLNYVRTHKEELKKAPKHKGLNFSDYKKKLTDEQLNKRAPNFDELVHLYVRDKITQLQFVNYVESHKDLK